MNNTVPGKDTSIWMDTTSKTSFNSLEGDIEVDVAVIGGGIAGLSTAYLLKKAGKKVAVLESDRIVKGTTGFTTGKITSAHGLIYKYLSDKFGPEKAKLYAKANQTAIEKISFTIKELKIDADFKRLPAYTYSISKDTDLIMKEVEIAKKLGLPVSFTKNLPLPFSVSGAIKYENQLRWHPRKYLLALAKHIDDGKDYIFEKTSILKVTEGTPNILETNHGKVIAKDVVIATNFPIYDPNRYFARLTSRQSLAIAVDLKTPVPQGMFFSTEKSFHSLRPQPYKNGEALLVGGELFKSGQGGDFKPKYDKLIEWTKDNFPVKSVLYHWTTSDSESGDRVPLIGPVSSGSKYVYVITGFNGWGMTHSTVAAILISDLILKNPNPWAKLYDPSRISTLVSKKSIFEDINSITNLIKGKFSKKDGLGDLQNGEGKVIYHNGEKLAVSKDESGKIQAVSAICTHMGCTVGWNKQEKTWDCPCHGSRYSTDGIVIHSPAVKNLEKKEL